MISGIKRLFRNSELNPAVKNIAKPKFIKKGPQFVNTNMSTRFKIDSIAFIRSSFQYVCQCKIMVGFLLFCSYFLFFSFLLF